MNPTENIPDHIRKILASNEPLDPQDERLLIERAKRGDKEARDAIVMSNYRYITFFITRFINIPHSLSFEDIINSGVIGLLKAVDAYDFDRGGRFITYAHWWIRKEIVGEIYRSLTLVTVPATKLKALEMFDKIRQQRENEEIEDPFRKTHTVISVAEEILASEGGSSSRLEAILAAKNSMNVVYDSSFSLEEEDYEFHEYDKSLAAPGYVESCSSDEKEKDRIEAAIDVEKAFAYVEGREEDIVKRRFGIGCKPQTFGEIAAYYAISPERVRQIVHKTLEKIKERWGEG